MITDINKQTPIEKSGNLYFKRDDYFIVNGAGGGKSRSCLYLATELNKDNKDLVTAGSRLSPQINIVSKIAEHLGLKSYAHCPSGELSDVLNDAVKHGINLVRHKVGYNNVIIKRAKDDCLDNDRFYIPFGMECEEAVNQTAGQVKDIPTDVKRIIIPVGSGMSLAGVLTGLVDNNIKIPVLGVVTGADPTKRLDKYAPVFWRTMMTFAKSELDYHKKVVDNVLNGINLDPIYESKCIPFVKDGDLFWIVGNRKNSGLKERK